MDGKTGKTETTFVVAESERPYGFYLRKWIIVILLGVGLAGLLALFGFLVFAIAAISASKNVEVTREYPVCSCHI